MCVKRTSIFTSPKQDNKNEYEDVNNLTNDNASNLVGTKGVGISVADLAYTYEGVEMGVNVLKEIVNAHNEVLTHGLTEATEMVIAIDLETGKTVAKAYGTETSVACTFPKNYKGKCVTIHNHLSSNTFSLADISTFSNEQRVDMIIIQGHNGKIYSLQKTRKDIPAVSREYLEIRLIELVLPTGYIIGGDRKLLETIQEELILDISKENYWIYKGGAK
ncbi:MAG: hypothetical protein FWG68_12115 [Defluviitaleaceae bacterium]|nr:hypothetical protein [Defluviitaleaceae bacterium]